MPNLASYQPLGLALEFERTIKRELDFAIERRTMERCRIQFQDDQTAHIPFVVEELSTASVIAMEFMKGVPVDDVAGIKELGLDPAEVAATGARILLKQIFEFGFFHADPHPGNLRVMPGGAIGILDYGMFGQLDGITRERIAELIAGLLAQDSDRVIRALERLEIRSEDLDPRTFRRDIGEIVASYAELTLQTIDLSLLLGELISVIRTHHLHIPPDLVLLIRSLVTIEGVGRHLDPRFDIAKHLAPFIRNLAFQRFRPDRILSRTVRSAEDVQRIATLLPDLLSQSLESIKRGELRVRFDLQDFERMVRKLTRASNSLTVGIVIAGLFVASSLMMRSGSVTIAYAGFITGLLLCLWLVWNMSND